MLFLTDGLWLWDAGRKKEICLFFVSLPWDHKFFWKKDKGDNSGVCNLEKTHAFCFATRSHFCFKFSAQLSSLFMNSLWTFTCPKLDNYHKPYSKCKYVEDSKRISAAAASCHDLCGYFSAGNYTAFQMMSWGRLKPGNPSCLACAWKI